MIDNFVFWPSIPAPDILVMWLSTVVAYVIFGIAGFGTALVASPMLAFFMPVSKIVPLLALLDFSAAVTKITKDRNKANVAELKRLVPLMIVGSIVGAGILFFTKPDILLLLLGAFVVCYSIYSLSGYKLAGRLGPKSSIPFGLVGGVFSALFGSGGFLYAIYLAGRIEAKEQIAVTQSTLIGLSTLTRLVLFLVAGIYADRSLLLIAAILAPAMLIGIFIGRHITLRLSKAQFIRVVNVLVLLSGIFLLIRYFSSN